MSSTWNRFNTHDPHHFLETPIGSYWSCILGASDPTINWGNAMQTPRNYFAKTKFPYLRCNRGPDEYVGKGVAEETWFWVIVLFLCFAVLVLRSRPRLIGTIQVRFDKIDPQTRTLAETEAEATQSHLKNKKMACRALSLILATGACFFLLISIFSLCELTGIIYLETPFLAFFTPGCAPSKFACLLGNDDITKPSTPPPPPSQQKPFSYLVASDSQLDWWSGESVTLGQLDLPQICLDDETAKNTCSACTRLVGEHTNSAQAKAMGKLLNEHEGLHTLVMNGDLTAYFHPQQKKDYESHFHNIEALSFYFPSLGNHDYDHQGLAGGGLFGVDQVSQRAKYS